MLQGCSHASYGTRQMLTPADVVSYNGRENNATSACVSEYTPMHYVRMV